MIATIARTALRAGFAAAAGLLSFAGPLAAQEEAGPPPPIDCSTSAPHRAFDFWVGEWDVYEPDGDQVGENSISVVEKGCALRERWRAVDGTTGQSLNYYDPSTGRWHQTWVSMIGPPLRLTGGPEGDSMVMGMETERMDHRITWTPLESGSVRQLWEVSRDGGATWEVAFEGEYRRDAGK